MYRFPNYPKKFIRIFSDICVYELIRLNFKKYEKNYLFPKNGIENV